MSPDAPVEFIGLDGHRWFDDVARPLPVYYFLPAAAPDLPPVSELGDEPDIEHMMQIRRFELREKAHGKRRWFVYQEVE